MSPECLIVTLTTWVISNVNKHDCKTNQTNALLLLVFIIGPVLIQYTILFINILYYY